MAMLANCELSTNLEFSLDAVWTAVAVAVIVTSSLSDPSDRVMLPRSRFSVAVSIKSFCV